jgi:hypothetical protein
MNDPARIRGGWRGVILAAFSTRHGRARPGHPRLCNKEGVDARDKRGHDGVKLSKKFATMPLEAP